MGEEPHGPAGALSRRARRPRAADPRGPDARDLRGLRASQGLDGQAGLRGHARARLAAVRRAPRGRRRRSRRASPRSPWTSTRTSTRCRRRCSIGGWAIATRSAWSATTTRRSTPSPAPRPSTCWPSPGGSRTRRRAARGELPIHAPGARAREPSGAAAGRVREEAAGERGRRGPAGRASPCPTRWPRSTRRRRSPSAAARRGGVPLEEMAVLYRINARSEPFEEAFAAAGIPYQVRDGAFLRRPGPRSVLQRLKRCAGGAVAEAVVGDHRLGWLRPRGEPDSDEEVTRQSDLARHALARGGVRARRPRRRPRGVRRRAQPAVLHRAQRPRA